MEKKGSNILPSGSSPQASKEDEERHSTAAPNSEDEEKENLPISKNPSNPSKTSKRASMTPTKSQIDNPRSTFSAVKAELTPEEFEILLSKSEELRLLDPDWTFSKKGGEKGFEVQLSYLSKFKKSARQNWEERYFETFNDRFQPLGGPKEAPDVDSKSDVLRYTILNIDKKEDLKSFDMATLKNRTDNESNPPSMVAKTSMEETGNVGCGDESSNDHKTGLHIIGPGSKGNALKIPSRDTPTLINRLDNNERNPASVVTEADLKKADDICFGEDNSNTQKAGFQRIGDRVDFLIESLDEPALTISTDRHRDNSANIMIKTSSKKADSNCATFQECYVGPGFIRYDPLIELGDATVADKQLNSAGFVSHTGSKKVNDFGFGEHPIKPYILIMGPDWAKDEFLFQDATAPINPLVEKELNPAAIVANNSLQKAHDVDSNRKNLNLQNFQRKSGLEGVGAHLKEGSNSSSLAAGPKDLRTAENQMFQIDHSVKDVSQRYTPEELGALGYYTGHDPNINFADQERLKACGSNWGTPDFCFKKREQRQSPVFEKSLPINVSSPSGIRPIEDLKQAHAIYDDELTKLFERKLKGRRLTQLENPLNPEETHFIRLATKSTPKKSNDTANNTTGSL